MRTSSSNLDLRMRKPRLLGIFLLAAALMSTGAEIAGARSADEDDVSVPLEWKNQIIADLEHNKRYLPRIRTRGRTGIVRFEFNMSRSGWVLPGTRIVTINPELGRAALLLIQQSQPFSPPEHVKLPDASFRLVVPIRFESIPPREAGLQDAERRKLLECHEADRQELEYQRRRAAYRHAEPPTTVSRMPEGCLEAKQQEQERQRQQAEEKEARAVLEERQRQEAKPKGLEYARTSGTTWRITRKKNATADQVDVTVESVQKNEDGAFASVEGVCRNATIVFFATLVDEAGAASLDFSDRVDGYRGIRTTYRVNDEIPSQKLIPQ